jgi:hypothetical protein
MEQTATPLTPGANGKALREVFRRRHGHTGIDEDFEANVRAVREIMSAGPADDPWRDLAGPATLSSR